PMRSRMVANVGHRCRWLLLQARPKFLKRKSALESGAEAYFKIKSRLHRLTAVIAARTAFPDIHWGQLRKRPLWRAGAFLHILRNPRNYHRSGLTLSFQRALFHHPIEHFRIT